MSDCCPRADGYHGPDCAEWWEQAYSSEHRKRVAAESQVAALTASLASVKEELADIMETYANTVSQPCAKDEVHCSCVPALRASLAELRKRYEVLAKAAKWALDCGDLRNVNRGPIVHALASPPSPAPGEKMPVATDTECLDWLDNHCSFVADPEYKSGPYKIGELRKMAYEGILTDILRAAPVESKPKAFHECGPECYATPPAADTANPSPDKV